MKTKNIICTILYMAVLESTSIAFTVNGFGVNTWQWWAQFVGIFVAHLLGMLRVVDFE
jgi:hypothetical protein